MEERVKQLESQVQMLLRFVEEKKRQQISYPLDEASRYALFGSRLVVGDGGNGGTALTQVYTDSNSDTHTGPKAYADTRLLKVGGVTIEVPYLSIS